MNYDLKLAVRFVLGAFTVNDIVGNALDWQYIKFNSQRFWLPISVQDKIESEAIQFCIDQGYLTEDRRLTAKGYLVISK